MDIDKLREIFSDENTRLFVDKNLQQLFISYLLLDFNFALNILEKCSDNKNINDLICDNTQLFKFLWIKYISEKLPKNYGNMGLSEFKKIFYTVINDYKRGYKKILKNPKYKKYEIIYDNSLKISKIFDDIYAGTFITKDPLDELTYLEQTNEEGYNLLIYAIYERNIDAIEILLDYGFDPNLKDNNNRTPIYHAYQDQNYTLIEFFKSRYPNLKIVNEYGYDVMEDNLFFYYVSNGDFDHVKPYVKNGILNNITSYSLNQALIVAIKKGYIDIFKYLIQNGADINVVDYNNNNMLMMEPTLEMVKFLLKFNINVNLKNKNGVTPLIYALKNSNIENAELLIEAGANIIDADNDGETTLMYAVLDGTDTVKFLLKYNGVINMINLVDNDGYTALGYAERYDQYDTFKLLIENGADIEIKNKKGLTPLMIALSKASINYIKLLLDHGADVNATNDEGDTPLMIATKKGYTPVKFLFNNVPKLNIKINAINNQGDNALMLAIKKSDNRINEYDISIRNAQISMIQLLIDKGININIKNNDGLTPLLKATQSNRPDIVHLLIKNGAR